MDWGNQNGKHVLLVHGVQDHCHNWDWVSEVLSREYHVVVPDLRGHGDSEWVKGSPYNNLDYVYDLAQLVEQEALEPLNIIGHSLGGTIAVLFAGIFPEKVASVVSVEGIGGYWYQDNSGTQKKIREWIQATRELAGRIPRKYPDLSDAFTRMQLSNPHLSEERVKHLTIHGSNRNEDGTYTWKFDNYTHSRAPFSLTYEDMAALWENIESPTLLLNGKQGFQYRIGQNDTLKHFKHVELHDIDDAGHWLHHDQFNAFIMLTQQFLRQNAR